jgi:hypothetical protein
MTTADAFSELSSRSTGALSGARVGTPNNTPDEVRRARQHVARNALDDVDCAELLAMLGLDGRGPTWIGNGTYGQRGRRRVQESE